LRYLDKDGGRETDVTGFQNLFRLKFKQLQDVTGSENLSCHTILKHHIFMKKLYFLLGFWMLLTQAVSAQQEHHYTQFMYNKLLLNPAYAGAREIPFLTGIARAQWVGFDGSPKSQLMSFNSPIKKTRIGFGANISHQKIGLGRNFYASMAYSYKLISSKKWKVRTGLMGSYRSISMDFQKAYALVVADQSLTDRMIKDNYFNVGAGIYANHSEKYYIGFSVPQLIGNILALKNPAAQMQAKEYRHFYLNGGASFRINNNLRFMPSFLLKYVNNAPFDADINLNLDVKKKTTFGLSYRLGGDGFGDSMDFLIYRQVNKHFGLGAAYDLTFSRIRNYTAGSFEIIGQYDLKTNKHTMSNPRFFF
jgi:type IX secretion system PorP/SprF family membrane protein